MRTSVLPRHGGVALIRGGVVQPQMTQDHTGSNLIAFDGSGRYVYGFNNETSEYGLRRLAVLSNGLREEEVVTVSSGAGYGTRKLEWSANTLSLGQALYRTPDLALVGQVGVATSGCRFAAAAQRLVCAKGNSYETQDLGLTVVDTSSMVVLDSPVYLPCYSSTSPVEVVPGPAGQAALRMNSGYSYTGSADSVWLFNSPMLP